MNLRRIFRKSQNIWGSKVPLEITTPTPFLKPSSAKAHSSCWILRISENRLHKLNGQHVPVLCHPHSDKVISNVQREPPMFQVLPIASCPIVEYHWAEPGSVLFTCSLQVFPFIDEILLNLLFFNSPISCNLYLHERYSKTLVIFVAIFGPDSFRTASFFFKDVCTDESQSHCIKLTIGGVRQITNACFFNNQTISSLRFNVQVDFGCY